MSQLTNFLKLFKWNTSDESDLEEEFDIDTSMNGNWDKLDEAIEDLDTNKVDKVDGKGLSTNDFTNEDKEKLNGLSNYDDTEIKQDIADIQGKNTEQDELIAKLKGNMVNLTAEGTSINVQDSSDLPAVLEVSGGVRQEKREGYNKFKTETYAKKSFGAGIPQADTTLVTINSHDENNVNFTTISNGYFGVLTEPTIIKNGETRYISMALAGDSNDIRVALINKTGDNAYESIEVKSNLANQKHEWTYTNNTGFDMNLCLGIYTNSTGTYTIDVSEIMITDTASKEYEAYGVMPSMEYPSEIKTVGASGSETITKMNSNIMPILNLATDWEYTESGIKNLAGNAGKTITNFDVKKGQTIKLGFKELSKPSATTHFTLYVDGEENTNISFLNIQFNNLNQTYEKTYTAIKDCNISAKLWGNADNKLFEFQLWANIDELEDYVQNIETDYTLDIQQEMLSGDYFTKESDDWKEVHGWSKSIYDETDDFSVFVADDVFQFYLPTTISQNAILLCNMFTQKNDWVSTSVVVSSNNQLYFLIKKEEYGFTADLTAEQALSKFKEIIATNNIVLYNTTAEIKLACTAEQSAVLDELQELEMFKGTNNIITADNLALLKLNYTVDTKSYIDSKLANLNEQVNTINELLSATETSSILLSNLQKDLESEVM